MTGIIMAHMSHTSTGGGGGGGGGGSITTAGLVLNLDAGNASSYPGTGTTWTDTVGGKTFTLYGNGRTSPNTSSPPTYNSADGGYLAFNSTNKQWARCTTSLSSLSSFTAEGWWYVTSGDTTTGNTAYCIITERFSASAINYAVGYGVNTQTGILNGGFYKNGYAVAGTALLASNFGAWKYMSVTYNNSTATLTSYINGSINGTAYSVPGSQQSPGSGGAGMHVATRWDTTAGDTTINYLNGRIAIIRVYDAALTSTQVTDNFNAEKARFGIT